MVEGGPREGDVKLGAFLAIPAPHLGKVEPLTGRSAAQRLLGCVFVPDDWKGQTRKVCPRCHLYLPHATASGLLGSEAVAIIGARSAGKSNYFGLLLQQLERRYTGEVGFTMFDQDTFSIKELRPISSRRLYRERYGKRLYEDETHKAIDQTRGAAVDRGIRIPLIYRLEFRKTWLQHLTRPFSRRLAMDLVIFDAAGEDMGDPETLERFYSYISAAAGIIFIIDPFQYPGLRSQLDSVTQKRLPKVAEGPVGIVSRVVNLFESRGRVRPGHRINVPVAFAFTKSDLLRGLLHPTSRVLRDSRHEGGFNRSDCEAVSQEVMECIRVYDSPHLVELAQHKFRSYSFFAVSALGQLPDDEMNIEPPRPLRVADPLLWLLWKRGYIPALPD
jgi:hypothetical protein